MTGEKRKRLECDEGDGPTRQRASSAACSPLQDGTESTTQQLFCSVCPASHTPPSSTIPASPAVQGPPRSPSPRDTSQPNTASQLPDLPSLTTQNATQTIATYIGSLRNDLSIHNARYVVDQEEPSSSSGNKVRCTLHLPHNCPIQTITPDGTFRSKREARQAAAYDAVIALNLAGEIDDNLQPTPANPTPRKRPAVQPGDGLKNDRPEPTNVTSDMQ